MFKHILVPIDGSEAAQSAVDKAAGLAKAFGSAITVIYVIDPYPFTGLGSDFAYGQAEYLSAASAEATQATKTAMQTLTQAGLKAKSQVVEEHGAWRGILESAKSLDCDLIVMGSHGRHGLEKVVLGSVAQRVLSHAHIPVMVVRD
ncbi:MAG: universal stress protein [Hylemonella sp.]|nr:universal stress protein [Hylemonella sp.]